MGLLTIFLAATFLALASAARVAHVALAPAKIKSISARPHFNRRPILVKATQNHIDHVDSAFEGLRMALRKGERNIVNSILNKGITNVDRQDDFGWTPLLMAASKNWTSECIRLMDMGANPDATSSLGDTPLKYAIRNKNEPLALEFVKRNAPVNIKIDYQTSALSFCSANMPLVALELIKRGARIDDFNYRKETPLLVALKHNNTKVAIELIKRGAFLGFMDDKGNNALKLATIFNQTDVIKAIEQKTQTITPDL